MYWAYQVLVISLIVSIVSHLTWKNKPAVILGLVLTALSTVFYFGSFQTVYADPLLALFFGYSLILAASDSVKTNKWQVLNLSITLAMLSITKDIGIFLSAISVLVYFVNSLFLNPQSKTNNFSKFIYSASRSILIFAPVFILKYFWKYALDKGGIEPGRDFFKVLSQLLTGSFSNLKQPYWNDVISAFITRSTDQSLTGMNGYPISALKWIVIYTMLFFIGIYATKSNFERVRESLISFVIVFGFFVYMAILLVLYLTSFSQAEAIGLASYDRYVTAYFAAIALFITAKAIKNIELFSTRNDVPKLLFAWLLVLMMQASPWNLLSYVASPNAASDSIRAQFDAENQMIKDMNFTVDDNVWFIAQHTVGFEFYMFQYELLPASIGRSPWSIGSGYGPGDLWTDTTITPKDWNKRLNNFDFVFVHSVTDSFKKEFKSMFQDPKTLDSPSIYKVEHEKEGNILVKVR